ncbi:MAG: ribonuclease HII [Gaiellaceae bacterium]
MPRTGRKLLAYDRRLGVRFVAGTDEAGRGCLAGPLVTAGVLFDYARLRGRITARLGTLNDSKQLTLGERERLYGEVLGLAARISVQVIPPDKIDRAGLHRSNLAGLRRCLSQLAPPAEVCLVDGFRLGPEAPEHLAVVDGDQRSAAIAAASIVAKVVRDRVMRRFDALYPGFGFASHVGYITPRHSDAVRDLGPSCLHRMSFRARCYEEERVETAPPEMLAS